MVESNAWANDDNNPCFMENSPFGGRIASPPLDDKITTNGIVREKVTKDDAVKLILDVWCENQHGERVVLGTATGLVRQGIIQSKGA